MDKTSKLPDEHSSSKTSPSNIASQICNGCPPAVQFIYTTVQLGTTLSKNGDENALRCSAAVVFTESYRSSRALPR